MQAETSAVERRILVVEDEVLTAKDLQRTLERLGYDVLQPASSAREAVDLAREHKPDLVLMDIHLDGMSDGIEAADTIRSGADIPIVFVTAFADADTVQRAKRVAPYGYILKPIRVEELRVVVDLALHKHEMEKLLRERERWSETTLHAIADAVIGVDPRGVVTFMNSAAEFMTGVPRQHGIGRHVREVLKLKAPSGLGGETDENFDMETPLEQTLREGRIIELTEARLKNLANDEELTISDSAAQVVADGQLLGAVMVFHNITAQKQLHASLLISERMASVGLLAAGVAHEINNPLSVVIGNADLMKALLTTAPAKQTVEDQREPMLEMLDDILVASVRMRDTVRDLNLFSKSETPELRNVNLREAMQSTLRLANNTLRQRTRIETHYEAAPIVRASESRLGQVFLNLLINAAHSIEEGRIEQNCISITISTPSADSALVEITDTGSGMSEATLKRLYTPFFTTKPVGSGTGLGLSICRKTILSLGGTIAIESKLGHGTTVRVVLPVATTTSAHPQGGQLSAQPRRARIMLIDDEAMVARVLERLLARDHDVSVFDSAKIALDRIAEGERYDAILCDLMMPDLNGIDFYEQLAARWPELAARMIVLTGGSFTARAELFFEQTRTPALTKPIDFSKLQALIAERISASRGSPERPS
jgi:signal transduction histidine kinase